MSSNKSGQQRPPVKNFGSKSGGGQSSSSSSSGGGHQQNRVLNKSIAGGGGKYNNSKGAGDPPKQQKDYLQAIEDGDAIDAIFGFDRLSANASSMATDRSRIGWLLNYLPICMPDETGCLKSGLDLFFIDREGGNFKCSILHEPYFYVDVVSDTKLLEVSRQLQKRVEGCRVDVIDKEDLDMPNHLSGLKKRLLKLIFGTQEEMQDAIRMLRPVQMQNSKRMRDVGIDAYLSKDSNDPFEYISEMREYDVLYPMRASIDLTLRVGAWFLVTPPQAGTISCTVAIQMDLLELCEPRVLAFDIECEKSPLKFPNAERDRIFMISYMVAGLGFLLINREMVSEDIADFEYTPMAKYPGPFTVTNLPNEEELLKYFLSHVQSLRPHVIVTYNGDFFDWPYVEKRCDKFQLNLYKMLGVRCEKTEKGKDGIVTGGGEYTGRCMVHLDAFCWVERDSYLPQGNHGLKAVTREKLGYDPVEVDPELMVAYAMERPHHMASYSVSDAVATYYLYQSYIHNFIFSLATIIPLGPEDVLRKGSGTLCEALLMVEAYKNNIIAPNKHSDPIEQFYKGHLLESETYIGGHVECLEAGVFRNDIPVPFKLIPAAIQGLIDKIDRDLTFAIEIENGLLRSDVTNYDDVRQFIVGKLELLRDTPNRIEKPVIYHLDVGAMYPNIILTNRLQPSAMVTAADCAACDYNKAENGCKRPMAWTWRGDYSPSDSGEYQTLKRQLSYEKVEGRSFTELSEKEQQNIVEKRVKQYSQTVYKKNKITKTEERVNTVCMREHGFYVDTVRAFRDRRYDYKLLTKKWKGEKGAAEKKGDPIARRKAEDMEILMDSLQLAHKCILNSFYGYVMRKGARWRSMEMAGIVTHTGSQLIQQARELVEQVGRPLELDTDGIWCILPGSFPQDIKMTLANGKTVSFAYPCAMLNADVHENYTNHQYQDLVQIAGKTGKTFASRSECSIYFELDGPYKAMVLPASPEEGILLKKKYVVYALDGSISELKGFEIKRRGELEIVKIFQEQTFNSFMEGDTLEGCYRSVGDVANEWLDVLDSKGINMDDTELLELISERKTISKTLDDYEDRKATALTSATRLGDFLGAEMVKDKGLNASLVISRLPLGAPVTDRAIPVAIFTAEPAVKRHYLRKWLKDQQLDENDFRNIIDWDYYKGRLAKTIQKIITIPSGMQMLDNPVPRVVHPSWLTKRLADRSSKSRQGSILTMFGKRNDVNSKKTNSLTPSKPLGPRLLANTASPPLRAKGSTQRGLTGEFLAVRESSDESKGENGMMDASFTSSQSPAASSSFAILQSPLRAQSSSKKRERERLGIDDSAEALDDGKTGASLFEEEKTTSPPPPEVDLLHKQLKNNSLTPEADFSAWLQARKETWRGRRVARQAADRLQERSGRSSGIISSLNQKPGRGDVSEPSRKKVLGVEEFARNASKATLLNPWQIVEIQAMDHPGDFTFWVFTRPTELQRIRVTIPRIIYVNCRSPSAEAAAKQMGGVKVQRFLPHGRPCLALYEVQVPERKFIKNEKVLNLFLSDPSVEGVYESKVPLDFRALVQLGCVARLCKETSSTGVQRNYKFSDLEHLGGQSHRYLMTDTAVYRKIFVYLSTDKSRNSGLGCISIFSIDSTSTDNVTRSFVWWCNGSSGLEVKPPMQRLFREQQPNEDLSSVKFQSYSVRSMEEAYRSCNEKLESIMREKRGPTIVTCQGGGDRRRWRKVMSTLQNTPVSIIPSNSNDDQFKAINWQMDLAKIMIERFLHYDPWFRDRLERSRQGDVPFCNLGVDSETTLTDICFARSLRAGRHLLWASDGHEPDIGGSEGGGLSSVIDSTSSADDGAGDMSKAIDDFVNNSFDRKNKTAQQTNDSTSSGCINTPGAYRSMCVELEVYWLAVASILQAHTLDAQGLLNPMTAHSMSSGGGGASLTGFMGGGGGGESFQSGREASNAGSNNMSSESSCSHAFLLLKAAVEKMKIQTATGKFPLSNRLLNTLYRYLCGAGGKAHGLLHDPLLEKTVRGLMNKMFLKLMAALKKLGAKIIYADYNRIILFTNKHDLASVKEYINFIFMAISNTDGFEDLQINQVKYWSQLLWLDRDNYGGIAAKEPVIPFEIGLEGGVFDDDFVQVDGPDTGGGHSSYGDVYDEDEDGDGDREGRGAEEEGDDDEGGGDGSKSMLISSNTNTNANTSIGNSKSPAKIFGSASKKTVKFFSSPSKGKGLSSATPVKIGSLSKSPAKSNSMDEYAFLDEINKNVSSSQTSSSSAGKKNKNKKGDLASGILKTGESGELYIDNDDQDDWNDEEGYIGGYNNDDDDDAGFIDGVGSEKKKKGRRSRHRRGSNLDSNGEVVSNLDDSRDEDADLADDVDYEGEENDDEEVDEVLNDVESRWTLTDFLKKPANAYFVKVVAAYLIHFRQTKVELREKAVDEDMTDQNGIEDQIFTETNKKMTTFINDKLLQYLLHKVSELEKIFPTASQGLGGHSELIRISTPTLDFIKFTTAVLGLDSIHCDVVASVRRTLLTQIKVREFSPEGQFASPCPSFVLKDVICIFCNNCQDVDLLRDNMYNEEVMDDHWYSVGGADRSATDSVVSKAAACKWICRSNGCVCEIDKSEIENRLLQLVESLSVAFVLQDFRCPRSFRASMSLVSAFSESSLPLALDFSFASLRRQLMVLSLVAVRHGFKLLFHTIHEMLAQHK